MKRFLCPVLLLVAVLGVWVQLVPVASAVEVQVPAGNAEALLAAIASARTSGAPTKIVLAAEGTYVLPAEEIHFGGETTLDGNGSTLQSMYTSSDGLYDRGTLFRIDAGSSITIANADFSGAFDGWPWLESAGQLTLRSVSIHGELGVGPANILPMAGRVGSAYLLATNGARAQLEMLNVTIDVTAQQPNTFTPEAIAEFDFSLLNIRNGGTASLQHVTMRAQRVFAGNDHFGLAGIVVEQGIEQPQVSISNSLIVIDASVVDGATATTVESPCVTIVDGAIVSNGGNIVTEPGCEFGRTVSDAGFGSFGDHGGPVPTLSLRGVSPAIDIGTAAYCLPTDARGYRRGAACDAGAFEFGAASAGGGLHEFGAGGYWYEPGTHGFLAVSFPGSENSLLVWSTFDTFGNPATVYGVGDFVDEDTIVITDATVDLPIPGSAPVPIKPVRWGELRFDIESCSKAQFSYETSMAGFASGEKELNRLTFFSYVGCSEFGD